MKKVICLLSVLVAFSFASTIGFIDVESVFKSYKETKVAQEEFNSKMKDYKKAVSAYQQRIDNAKIDGKTEDEIAKITADMKKELEPKETEIKMYNDDKMAKIRKSIVASVEAVSKELGIDVVVDKQVIIAGGTDITDQVVYKLNKSSK